MKFNQIVLVVLVFEMIAITQPDPVLCSVQWRRVFSKKFLFLINQTEQHGFFLGMTLAYACLNSGIFLFLFVGVDNFFMKFEIFPM